MSACYKLGELLQPRDVPKNEIKSVNFLKHPETLKTVMNLQRYNQNNIEIDSCYT